MKILCYVCHYFGKSNKGFSGKSSDSSKLEERKNTVEKCIEQLKTLGDVTLKVCGIEGYSAVPIDMSFDHLVDNPTDIVYQTLAELRKEVDNYDYFICIEDDIFVPKEAIENVIEFDKTSLVNEILHPNRLETDSVGTVYCTDLFANRNWTMMMRKYKGKDMRVAFNPHSALAIFSQEKFRYALEHTDPDYREICFAYSMDSAFAYYHAPFVLWRYYNDVTTHVVRHENVWKDAPKIYKDSLIYNPAWNKVEKRDFFPPIIMKSLKYLLGKPHGF